MANYAVPSNLFPPDDLVTSWSSLGTWTPFEQELRLQALSGYRRPDSVDKELSRFVVPEITWAMQASKTPFCTSLGTNSWIASASLAPFIPSAIQRHITELYAEPRSGAHFIGATFTDLTILYCANNLDEIILPQPSVGARELLLIIVEPNVQVTIADIVRLEDSQSARSVVGCVGAHATLSLVGDFHLPGGSMMQHDRWYIESNGQMRLEEVLTGGRQSWIRKEFILSEQAKIEYSFLAALQEHEQALVTTVQEHRAPASLSSVLVKVALSDSSRSFYRGTISIAHEAPKSVANQQQRALMLSPHAQTCAIPSLEVATHEVQCAHGSAAGRFNEEELWYMFSRGLSKEQAEAVLIEGFFNEPLLVRRNDLLTRLKERTVPR